MRRIRPLILALLIALSASPAYADATAFIGTTATPSNRTAKGFAIGMGLLIVGFEFEFSSTSEDPQDGAPALRTGMANALLQTPFAIFGFQPYATAGAGGYREELGDRTETSVGMNTGGGVKISLIGPFRARIDYRVFRLQGDPLHETVQRVYAGVNLAF